MSRLLIPSVALLERQSIAKRVARVWLACFASAAATAQFDFDVLDKLYPEDFFQPPAISQLTLSPSGSQYVYAYSKDRVNSLQVVDLETGEKRPFVGKNITDAFVSFIAWKNENQIVFQTSDGNVFNLDLKKGKRDLIFDADRYVYFFNAIFWGNFSYPRIVSLLPNDPKNILVAAFNENGSRVVYKIPLAAGKTGKHKVHVKPTRGINSWYSDLDGEVRLGIKSDENGHAFFFRPEKSNNWIPLNKLFDEDSAVDLSLNRSNFLNRRDYFAGFKYDSNSLYIASNRKSDTITLYEYDMDTGSVVSEVARDPEYDFFDISQTAPQLWVSSKRRKTIGIPYETDTYAVHWLDDEFKRVQEKVDSHLPESVNRFTSWNYDETKFIVVAIRSDKPHEYFLYDTPSDTLKSLGGQNETLKNKTLFKTQPITLENRDGLTLRGYLTLADSQADRPAPLVMMPHGGPWARDSFGYDPSIQWLAYNGYSVLQVNFRGSIGFGYDHYIASRQDFGWGIQKDISDTVDWAVAQGHASSDNIAIMGFSYGGYATLLALANQPGKYRCGIAMAGVYDLVQTSKSLKSGGYSGIAYEHFREMVGREWKDRDTLRSISPVFLADQIEEPVLLVHGKLDVVANYEQSEAMQAALEKSGKSNELISIQDEGHGFYRPRNQIEAYGSAVEFLDKHMSK